MFKLDEVGLRDRREQVEQVKGINLIPLCLIPTMEHPMSIQCPWLLTVELGMLKQTIRHNARRTPKYSLDASFGTSSFKVFRYGPDGNPPAAKSTGALCDATFDHAK